MFLNRNYLMRLSVSLAIIFISSLAFGQEEEDNECVRILKKAQKAYEDGLIEKIDQMVRPCLEGTELSKEDKMEGYKLLAMAHTYDGKDELAEDAMLKFLKLEPEYEIQPGIDPKEFSALYSNYHTSPLYTVGGYIGVNWAMARPYNEFGLYNTELDKKKYKSSGTLQFGIRGTRYLYKGLNVHLDLAFVQNTFIYNQDILESYTNVNPVGEPASSPQRGVSIESTESHTALSIPISFSYTFLLQKQIKPYALLGFETRYLISATNQVHKSYLDPNIASVEINDIEGFQDTRNSLTFAGVVGVGGKYKIKGGDIFMEARYHIGLSDQVSGESPAVNDDERIWNFYQQDNQFTLNTLFISVGYNKYLYKPRKMKENTTGKKPPKEKKKKEKKDKSKAENQRQVIE